MAARSGLSSGRLRNVVRRALRGIFVIVGGVLASYLGACILLLSVYSVVFPPVTGVQIERYIEAISAGNNWSLSYHPVSRDAISAHARHAVIAAEDTRFYEHRGIDWQAVREAAEELQDGDRRRGGSTITQQLVKNLFMTTHPNYFRKIMEVPLAYAAEFILGKERILDLYVNIVELDDGIFGVEAAAQHYFGISARDLSRWQAAGLAACLPNPRQRSPQAMSGYTNTIINRMNQLGW